MNKGILMATGLALTLSLTGCAIIGPGERGIKQSFGKIDDRLMEPGLNSYNAFTETIQHMSIQQQTYFSKDPDNQLSDQPMTASQMPIKMEYAVMVRFPEGQLVNLVKNYRGDPFNTLIAPKVNEAIREVVASYQADEVSAKATEISSKVLTLAREKVGDLAYIADIPIQHFELPQQIQTAIKTKQVMQQQALQKRYELEAAQTQAKITVANAEAQARSIQLQSEAFQKSPQLIEYEKAKRWNGQLPTTMIMGGNTPTLFKIN